MYRNGKIKLDRLKKDVSQQQTEASSAGLKSKAGNLTIIEVDHHTSSTGSPGKSEHRSNKTKIAAAIQI